MAPVCSAGRRSLSYLFLWIYLWMSIWASNCCTRLVYDRQSLLNIRTSFMDFYKQDVAHVFNQTHRNTTTHTLECIRQWPLITSRRKRRRKRGSRGGRIIRLKTTERLRIDANPNHMSDGNYVARRPRALAHRWLQSIIPPRSSSVHLVRLPRVGRCHRQNGVNPGNLRSLKKGGVFPVVIHPPKMALINARSLVNKTFLLNDFFSSHSLDFMFITESWTTDTSLLKMKMSCSDFGSVFLFSQELGSQMGLTEFPPDEDLL